MNNDTNEKSLLIIKNDGLKFINIILKKLTENKINIIAIKTVNMDEKMAKNLYYCHKDRYFYAALIEYMSKTTCMALAVEGNHDLLLQAKKDLRENLLANIELNDLVDIMKHPRLSETDQNTFLKEYKSTFDLLHCSDAHEGENEINIFFDSAELNRRDLSSELKSEIISKKIVSNPQFQSAYNQQGFFGVNVTPHANQEDNRQQFSTEKRNNENEETFSLS